MAKINITPEMLEGRAKDMLNKDSEHQQVYEQIKQLVNNVVDVWEGESQKAFLDSFQQKDATFRKFSEEIQAFAELMNTAARRMRETEESLTSQMRR